MQPFDYWLPLSAEASVREQVAQLSDFWQMLSNPLAGCHQRTISEDAVWITDAKNPTCTVQTVLQRN